MAPTTKQISYALTLGIRDAANMDRFALSEAISNAKAAKEAQRDPRRKAKRAAYALGIFGEYTTLKSLNVAIQRRLRVRFRLEMVRKGSLEERLGDCKAWASDEPFGLWGW